MFPCRQKCRQVLLFEAIMDQILWVVWLVDFVEQGREGSRELFACFHSCFSFSLRGISFVSLLNKELSLVAVCILSVLVH